MNRHFSDMARVARILPGPLFATPSAGTERCGGTIGERGHPGCNSARPRAETRCAEAPDKPAREAARPTKTDVAPNAGLMAITAEIRWNQYCDKEVSILLGRARHSVRAVGGRQRGARTALSARTPRPQLADKAVHPPFQPRKSPTTQKHSRPKPFAYFAWFAVRDLLSVRGGVLGGARLPTSRLAGALAPPTQSSLQTEIGNLLRVVLQRCRP